MRPSPGDLLLIDGRASVQFAGDRALTLRVVSVCDRPTYAGWIWLTGYVINRAGRATTKREVYLQLPASSVQRFRAEAATASRGVNRTSASSLCSPGPSDEECAEWVESWKLAFVMPATT